MQLILIYLFLKRSACFRRFLRPSSAAHNCTHSFRYCQSVLLLAGTVLWTSTAAGWYGIVNQYCYWLVRYCEPVLLLAGTVLWASTAAGSYGIVNQYCCWLVRYCEPVLLLAGTVLWTSTAAGWYFTVNHYCCWLAPGSSSSGSQYLKLCVQLCAPDDGRRNRLKHVERFRNNWIEIICVLSVVIKIKIPQQ